MNYTFIILVPCSDAGLFIDPTLGCVCAVGYSQTTAATATQAPVCEACTTGTTTGTNRDTCG